jgi:hypothetical protein
VGLGGLLLGYIALRFCSGYLEQLRVLADTNARVALEKLGELFRLGVLTLVGSLCSAALLLGLLARRVLREERFPPVGMKVLTDTRVVTGNAARSRAELALVLAGTMLAMAFCLLLWAWRSLKTIEITVS